MSKFVSYKTLAMMYFLTTFASGQSTFDLDPPLQANPESTEFNFSPDPDALPVFKFATAEINKDGNILIATKVAKQTLVAPLENPVPPALDPKGIRYTEMVLQTYTVSVPYTETVGDGDTITKIRTETRTRKVPVVRYRERTDEEQAEFEEQLARHQAKKQSGETQANSIEPAVAVEVSDQYQVNIPYNEVVDGVKTLRLRTETRSRNTTVHRGKTKTESVIKTVTLSLDKIRCFSVDGTQLDNATIKKRLSERSPVVLLNSDKAVAFEYFESLLKPNVIFVVIKQ